MATIDKLLGNMITLDMTQVLREALYSNQAILVRYQRLQLLQGYKGDGKRIGRYKSPQYAIKKALKNPLAGTGFVDLRLSGAWYNDIFVEIRDRTVLFENGNEKTADIFKKYGDPLGLSKKNAKEVSAGWLMPTIARMVRQKILR